MMESDKIRAFGRRLGLSPLGDLNISDGVDPHLWGQAEEAHAKERGLISDEGKRFLREVTEK